MVGAGALLVGSGVLFAKAEAIGVGLFAIFSKGAAFRRENEKSSFAISRFAIMH